MHTEKLHHLENPFRLGNVTPWKSGLFLRTRNLGHLVKFTPALPLGTPTDPEWGVCCEGNSSCHSDGWLVSLLRFLTHAVESGARSCHTLILRIFIINCWSYRRTVARHGRQPAIHQRCRLCFQSESGH